MLISYRKIQHGKQNVKNGKAKKTSLFIYECVCFMYDVDNIIMMNDDDKWTMVWKMFQNQEQKYLPHAYSMMLL